MSIFNKNKNLENNENENKNKNIKPKRNFFKALLVALGLSAGVATLTTGCGDEKQAIEQENKDANNFRNDIKVSKEEQEKAAEEAKKKEEEEQQRKAAAEEQKREETQKKYDDVISAANEAYEEKTGYDTDNIDISYIYQENANQAYSYLWEYTDNDGKKVFVHNNYFTENDANQYGLDSVESDDYGNFPNKTVVAIDRTHHEIMYGAYEENDEYGDFVTLRYRGQSGESVNPGGNDPRNCIKISEIYSKYNNAEVDKEEFSKDLFNAVVSRNTGELVIDDEKDTEDDIDRE